MRKNVSKTTTKCNAIKVLSVALLAGLSVIGSNPASADSTYSTLNDALVDATTPRSYTVSQEGETLSQNQDTVAAGDLKISGVSSENPSVLDASGSSIFNIANETNLILKDLDIKNAFTTGSGSVLKVTNKNATAELLNVRISNSSSNGDGGVIYNIGNISAITGYFTDNKIVENSSGNDGGAIYNVNGGHIGTIDATFKNNGINNNNGWGGAIANEGATIDKISGQFIDNYVKTVNSLGAGGAIANKNSNSIIGEINANFSGNFVESTNLNSFGGAISNMGKISSVSGVFNNNYTKSINYAGQVGSFGGAIYNEGNIGDIKANFDGNFADSEKSGAYGGAICNKNRATIGNIWGDFSNNRIISTKPYNPNYRVVSASGAAISNFTDSEIGNISGNFTNNSASAVGTAYGGVIHSVGKIGDIKGVFNGNKVISSSDQAAGGAIANGNSGEMGNISATFMNNYIKGGKWTGGSAIYNYNGKIGNVAGDFIQNAAESSAGINGGVISNQGTMAVIKGNFSNNSSLAASWLNGSVISNTSNSAIIEQISGVIANNYSKAGTYNYGTMLFNKGKINELNASFLNNTGVAETYSAGTVANYTNGNIGSIKGDFIGNKNCGVSDFAAAAGVQNRATIGEIKGNFVNNSALAKTFALGGALYNQGTIGSISGSFIGNGAKTSSDSQLAFGGAVYSDHTDLNFAADNTTNIFSGNYTEDSRGKLNNAIFVRTNEINSSTGAETFYNPMVTFNAKNNGQFVIDDTIDGGEINSDYTEVKRNHQYNINLTGDKSGKITLNNNIYNANISQLSVTSFVNDASQLNYGNSLAMNSGVMNINHLGLSSLNLKSFSNSGTINLNSVDINPATETMGRITADSYGSQTGTINVNGLNVLADPNPDKLQTNVLFADSAFANTVKYNGAKEYVGKIYKYSVGYSPSSGEFQFVRGGGSSGGTSAFNPSILNTSVNSQAGTNATVNETFKYVFEHADAFTQLPSVERFAKINENKYALSTDFNSNLPSISSEFNNKAGWFRPYVTFEKMNLRNASAVNATTYGSLVGFDSDFQTLKHGWTGVTTGYIGYTGSQLRYSGSDTTMNGGLLGLTQTFYKGSFWTALTATTGASAAQSTTMYGKEDFTTLFAGIGSKTGYNFEFKEGKYIVQPIWFMSYTMGKTFDYTNAAGVRIDSSPMHSIMLNPSIRFITNTRSGWQPYASVGMVWNAMSESNVKADGIRLPETSIKPYVEYGVGLQKRYKDDFIAFGQAMVRNGGRNGISLTAGFRWAIGKNKSNNPIEKVQKSNDKTVSMKKFLPPAVSFKLGLQDSSSRVQGERKVIKQLSETQRAKITKQYQNTTKTTYIGELRLL